MLDMDIQRLVDGPSVPDDDVIRGWVKHALGADDAVLINLRIVDQAEGWALNKQWRGKDYPTNVLSFPASVPVLDNALDNKRVLGDVVLCAPVIEREATEQSKSLESHWAHLVIHGLLHLHGFDHTHAEQAVAMEAREIELLAGLGFDNPYKNDHDN